MTPLASDGFSAVLPSSPARSRVSPRSLCRYLAVCAAALVFGASSSVLAQQSGAEASVVSPQDFREVAPAGGSPDGTRAEMARETLTDAEAAEPLQVDILLGMRNFAELERRVAAGETITPKEMAARFLPDKKEYDKVVAWLTAHGLTVTSREGASHTLVSLTGTPAQLAQVFKTRFAKVKFAGVEYTSAVTAPSLPAELRASVQSIHGLQPYLHPHKHIIRHQTDALIANGQPPFLVSDIATAYGIAPTGLTGAGQQIGIVIDTVPLNSDLIQFWSANGVSQTTNNIIIVNTSGRTIGAPTGEETLDVAWSSGLASQAQIVVYACSDLNYVNTAYSTVLSDLQSGVRPGLHQISMSFGAGEESDETPADITSVHQMFTAMAAYGVTPFAASGDDGAYGNGGEPVQALYPASDPLVTGVGATTINLSTTDAVTSEVAWSSNGTRPSNDSSSGSGISTFFSRPSWQVGTGVPAGTGRLVPDVAFAGDPNTGCYLVFKGRVEQDGGTSWGTPCWAALCALINQARANSGQPAITAFNPAIYPLLGTASFRDIVSGYNSIYTANVGYDILTGIGVPVFNTLSSSLSSAHAAFFTGETSLGNGVYYLQFPDGTAFGYYSYLSDPHYIYHFDLGYEYVIDANDGKSGAYFYDFASNDFFYTSPVFPFSYLYDFNLNSVLFYYPNASVAGRYTSNPRYFYDYATSAIITK